MQLSTITQIAALGTVFFCGVYLKRLDDGLKIQRVAKDRVYAEPVYLLKNKHFSFPDAKIEINTSYPTTQKLTTVIKEEFKLA